MSRSYGRAEGSVDVKQTRDAGAPEQFVWRGRLYRVQHVLQQWDTSVTWWKDVATAPNGTDLRTWRVEAAAGRCDTPGVYELSFDPVSSRWYLLRTYD
ncbi:MAG TPA: DUF6504 family protein [Actinomycetota bacterium]|jgi:hypothetical protein|nr:DUF6504 family protein [Actinomycetota bacterium]HUM87538.1 DUF6504 family protein [Actinomycetota bacterium]